MNFGPSTGHSACRLPRRNGTPCRCSHRCRRGCRLETPSGNRRRRPHLRSNRSSTGRTSRILCKKSMRRFGLRPGCTSGSPCNKRPRSTLYLQLLSCLCRQAQSRLFHCMFDHHCPGSRSTRLPFPRFPRYCSRIDSCGMSWHRQGHGKSITQAFLCILHPDRDQCLLR